MRLESNRTVRVRLAWFWERMREFRLETLKVFRVRCLLKDGKIARNEKRIYVEINFQISLFGLSDLGPPTGVQPHDAGAVGLSYSRCMHPKHVTMTLMMIRMEAGMNPRFHFKLMVFFLPWPNVIGCVLRAKTSSASVNINTLDGPVSSSPLSPLYAQS